MGENVKAGSEAVRNENIRNKIYFSKRLKEKLDLIPFCAITTLVAPTGYGKTTAARTFFKEKKAEEKIFWLSVHGGESSLFWHRVSTLMKDYPEIQKILKDIGTPETAYEKELFLEAFQLLVESEKEIYFIIDNFHLLDFSRANSLLTFLEEFMPENFHLVLLSRVSPLKVSQRVAFGGRINEISSQHLSLTEEEIDEYASLCNISLEEKDRKMLYEESEGWISIIYMNLLNYVENNEFLLNYSNVYPMVKDIFFEPLQPSTKEVLIQLALTKEGDFTKREAESVCHGEAVLEELERVSKEDNFIYYSDTTGLYHVHNILLQILREEYDCLPPKEKNEILIRYGTWYEQEEEIEEAIIYFYKAKEYERLLEILVKHQSSWQGQEAIRILGELIRTVPDELLLLHPEALVISMRRFILFKMAAQREKVQGLLTRLMSDETIVDEQRKNWIKGEYTVSLSLLKFNDIREMGKYQKKGWELLGKKSSTLDVENLWTQGSPSLLLSYYRKMGELNETVKAMYETMPTYYQLTGGHGKGAEFLLDSEANYQRGNFLEALKLALRAEAEAQEYRQWSLVVNAQIIILKCKIHLEETPIEDLFASLYQFLKDKGLLNLIFKVEIEEAYINSINNIPEKMQWIPTIEKKSSLPYLGAVPAVHLAYNQYLLSQKQYEKVLALEEKTRVLLKKFQTEYGSLILDLQLASAYLALQEENKAFLYLDKAMEKGEPDELVMPYVEAYNLISPLFEKAIATKRYQLNRLKKIKEIGEKFTNRGDLQSSYEQLSLKEREIAQMAAKRYTNKEIGEKLFLSVGTIKQYMNRIYNKIGIEGDAKNKKQQLSEYLQNY
ncbi:MAG TPA: LuxR C-terminal-related transcriptional regulator [Candidatus Dorea intestinavium]|nr:LuxR C-terminal-related transcriptional regulator [Candidatus Dorea intestinavium]